MIANHAVTHIRIQYRVADLYRESLLRAEAKCYGANWVLEVVYSGDSQLKSTRLSGLDIIVLDIKRVSLINQRANKKEIGREGKARKRRLSVESRYKARRVS